MQVIIIVSMFLCGTFSVTSNSRMMYAFSRDGAIPGSKFWHKVDTRFQSPIRTGKLRSFKTVTSHMLMRSL